MKYVLLFFFAVIGFVNAQNISVYYVTGSVSLQNTSKTVGLKENMLFNKGAKITLKKGASVVLFKAGKAVVLKEPKTYSYEVVLPLFAKNKRSLSGPYIAQLEKMTANRDKNDGYSNVNRMSKNAGDRGEGINFPLDSSIVLTDALALSIDKDALPGELFVLQNKQELYSLSVHSSSVKMYNIGLIEEGGWYGMAVTSKDNLPYAPLLHVKWASPAEVEAIKKEEAAFLTEIKDFPFAVQSQLIQLYQQDKRYVALEE